MAKQITFHSYKGGSGRSSTTLNTIPYLAEALGADAEHPILLLDLDIDSAGMTYLLGKADHFLNAPDVKVFLKGEIGWRTRSTDDFKSHGLLSHFVPVGEKFGLDNDTVLFFGVNDEKKIDNKEIDGTSQDLLHRLAVFADNNERIKAVVMDSASGEQTVANFATQFADTIVCCMRPTMQFRMGTFRFLSHLANAEVSTRIVLLPTVVPTQDVEIDGKLQREDALKKIRRGISDLEGRIEVDDAFVREDCFGINEVQRFKWQEGVLYKLEKNGGLTQEDEALAAHRYKKLAEVLANN